ncbi:MAG: MATE family efflux transporter, partial [Bacillota bacterium]|nr:MATE family efflux transporter [Bacillota bacterium]
TWIPVRLMTNEEALISMAEQCLYYVCLFYPLYGIVIISGNYFTSIGKAAVAFFVTISREFLMLLPMLFVVAPMYGLSGIWFALGAVDIPCFIVTLMIVIADIRRINNLKHTEEPLIANEA